MAEIGTDLERAVALLQKGEIVAIPTETVYGLAANALNPLAVAKIFEAKRRPFFDPLIVHISGREKINSYAVDIPDAEKKLVNQFWPGPLTIVLKKSHVIPDIVTAGLDSVGLRMPNHPLTLQLLRSLEFPLAAPSANPFGYVSPTTALHVNDQLGNVVKYILDGGPSTIGLESTIISFLCDIPAVTRLGGISVEEIAKALNQDITLELNTSSNPVSPGQLKSHYAPGKPLFIGNISEHIRHFHANKVGVISFKRSYRGSHSHLREWVLSPSGNLSEAAARLFSSLREADSSEIEILLAEKFPDKGIGRAINDRLERASIRERPF